MFKYVNASAAHTTIPDFFSLIILKNRGPDNIKDVKITTILIINGTIILKVDVFKYLGYGNACINIYEKKTGEELEYVVLVVFNCHTVSTLITCL